MHYLVQFIVEAENAEEANNQTNSVLENLIEWGEFDWYHTPETDSRWPDCWKPICLSEEKAKAIVQATLDEQFKEFEEALAAIRFMLETYNSEQIFNERFDQSTSEHYLSRYQFTVASGRGGIPRQLYGDGGGAIVSQRGLDRYLEKPEGLWVVQVDCHS